VRYARVRVSCRACGHQSDADLQALIDTGAAGIDLDEG
jgi:hypothetical protein